MNFPFIGNSFLLDTGSFWVFNFLLFSSFLLSFLYRVLLQLFKLIQSALQNQQSSSSSKTNFSLVVSIKNQQNLQILQSSSSSFFLPSCPQSLVSLWAPSNLASRQLRQAFGATPEAGDDGSRGLLLAKSRLGNTSEWCPLAVSAASGDGKGTKTWELGTL